MGPNPVKLTEELMTKVVIPKGSLVMDLGSGTGITSVFLAKEYGLRVIAADLWSNPTDNMRFFESEGLSSSDIMPIHADANNLPFAHEFFDAVVSTDSYNYFGRDS
ncbi:MAG TPA: class I SAM-dependent methyltransferase, partial [Methanocorpusculum sp.]|nr:class I SAM-dependent methyltransferase [Methanocorpusculum sp.]